MYVLIDKKLQLELRQYFIIKGELIQRKALIFGMIFRDCRHF